VDEIQSSDLVEGLREAAREYPSGLTFRGDSAGLVLLALATTVAAAGECRVTTPYASLRPILEEDGLRWACTHRDGEHRSQLVAGREP
jgi:hypothetical protein